MTKVKICGITNLEDALVSAKFGADALGFNFYEKSPRYIAPEKAREIIEQVPENILKVGVFVNESLEKIAEIAETAKLDALQLHGEETPEFARELKSKTNLEIIKAFRVSPEFKPEDVMQYEVDAILLDAYNPQEHGGTGETFDWEIAKKVRDIFPRMYLAGGLSDENIENAIKNVKPYYVDACSQIEINKGEKDKAKTRQFLLNARHTTSNPRLTISKTLERVVEEIGDLQFLDSIVLGQCDLNQNENKSFSANAAFITDNNRTLEISCLYDESNHSFGILVLVEKQQVFQAGCNWEIVNPYFSVYVANEGLINIFFEK